MVSIAHTHETDLTHGNIFSQIIAFSVPLLLGNLFQQFYNTVDTWVVGNFVGKTSFSAVGTLSSVTNTLIGFFTGFSTGASVVISQYFGAKDYQKVHDSVHTYVTVTLILCIVFTVLGLLMIPLMLKILGSPEEVAQQQKIYLTIYFEGISGLLVYNMGASIMRAVGNSTFPFVLLVVCAVSNIFLDILFVLVFHMGTEGVAWATVIAQGISALIVVAKLIKTESLVKVTIRKLKIQTEMLVRIIKIGFPSAVQMSITSFSNVFVQGYINFFGTDVMGGWTAYNKLDQLFFLPMQSIGLSTTTFVGQNIGSRNSNRARKGVLYSQILAWVSTGILVTLSIIAAPQLVKFFIDDSETEVIRYGVMILRLNGPFFMAACVNQVLGGALRSCGKIELTMVASLSSFVLIRQIYLFVVTQFINNTVQSVSFSYPFGWIICSVLVFFFYIKHFPKKDKS